jgi:hypothetical protein
VGYVDIRDRPLRTSRHGLVFLLSSLAVRGGINNMGTVSKIVKQLKKERDRVEKQLSGLNAALSAFAGVYAGKKPTRKRRTLSAAGRARIATAQRKRWAKIRAKRKV